VMRGKGDIANRRGGLWGGGGGGGGGGGKHSIFLLELVFRKLQIY